MLKIIDNKRIEMTQDEFKIYEQICASYKQGKILFSGLFETDENGIIVCLIPPKKVFTMEVTQFLQNLMVHQHMRIIISEHNEAMKELNELKGDLLKLKNDLEKSSESKKK